MGLNFGAILKLAKGGGAPNPQELKSLLKSLGIDLEMEKVQDGRGAFEGLAKSATKGGASLLRVRGTLQGGDCIDALVILNPSQSAVSVVTGK